MNSKININKIIKYSIFILILLFSFNGKVEAKQNKHFDRVCIYKVAAKYKNRDDAKTENLIVRVRPDSDTSNLKLAVNVINNKTTIDGHEFVIYVDNVTQMADRAWIGVSTNTCPYLFYNVGDDGWNSKYKITFDLYEKNPTPLFDTGHISTYRAIGNTTCNISAKAIGNITTDDAIVMSTSTGNKLPQTEISALSSFANESTLLSSLKSGNAETNIKNASNKLKNMAATMAKTDFKKGDQIDEWVYAKDSYTLTESSSCGATINNFIKTATVNLDAARKKLEESNNISKETSNEVSKSIEETTRSIKGMLDKLKGGFGIGNNDDVNCGQIFTPKLKALIQKIMKYIGIIVPVIIIILGSLDFAKVIVSSDKDALKKESSKFLKRCIVAVAIFFVPFIVNVIMTKVNEISGKEACLNETKDVLTVEGD